MIKTLHSLLTSRIFQFVVLPLAVLGWFLWTDPSHGADTLLRLQLFTQAILVTGLAYAIAKSMLGTSSSEELYLKCIEGNRAAGLAYVGVCLMRSLVLVGLLVFFALQR